MSLRAFDWMAVVLRCWLLSGLLGISKDSPAGRRQFELGMEERRPRDEPGQWKSVERGWCLGDEEFRQELLEQMEPKFGRHHGGPERQETAAARAERIVAEELKQRGWASDQLAERRKGDREKVTIARRLRKETTMTLDWIAQRLNMGAAGYAAQCLHQAR
jgi:hypothetical protein